MIKLSKNERWAISIAAIIVVLSAACVQLAPAARFGFGVSEGGDELDGLTLNTGDRVGVTEQTGAAGSTTTRRRTAVVSIGSIADVLSLSGRVAGIDETSLGLSAGTRVQAVGVRPGQTVEEGEILVEADSRDIVKELTAARSRLETSLVRLAHEQAQSERERQATGRRTVLDQARAERGLLEAEAGLRRAQEDLERMKAGPTPAERTAAEAAVSTAAAALERAQVDLTRLARPDAVETQTAVQEVASARLTLQRNEAELVRLRAGADAQEVRSAEREVLGAESALDTAQIELDRLTRGADPQAVRTAERELERAQNALRAAQAQRTLDAESRLARDLAIRDAQLDIKEAEERLAAVKMGPTAAEIDLARSKAQSARIAAESARDRLDRARRGPDALSVETAALAVDRARGGLQSAEARLAAIQAGPADHQVSIATAGLESASAALESARAKLADLNEQPRAADVRAAEDRVGLAQAALGRAQLEARLGPGQLDDAVLGLVLLQRSIDDERAQVDALERDMAATRLRAPFSGVVTAIYAGAGDSIVSGRPVIGLAKPGEALIRAPLSDREIPRVAIGQGAFVQAEGPDSQSLPASVEQVSDSETGSGKVALLRVAWGGAQPPYGTPVEVAITQASKEGVLLVPERAVRSNGARRYVEFMEGSSRRVVDVQVGMSGGGNVEILRGLVEGQVVLVRP